jgi:hypothetical protein
MLSSAVGRGIRLSKAIFEIRAENTEHAHPIEFAAQRSRWRSNRGARSGGRYMARLIGGYGPD